MEPVSLADALYGPIHNADTHAELYGSAPGGFTMDTRNGGEQTANAHDHTQALTALGPKALLGRNGVILPLVGLVALFLVLNGAAR